MNTKRAQREILNDLLAGKKGVTCQLDDDHIFVSSNGYVGYVFDKSEFFIETKNMSESNGGIIDKKVFHCDANLCTVTSDMKLLNGKTACVKLVQGNRDVWVDRKYLKNFDDLEEARFYQGTHRGMIYITEYDRFVGVVVPMCI